MYISATQALCDHDLVEGRKMKMGGQVEAAERRGEERFKFHKRAQFTPAGEELYEGAVILNQSKSGMLLSTQRSIVVGSCFEIDLVPLRHRARHPFVGQVVHIKDGHSRAWWGGHRSSYHYGCRMTSIDAEEEVALATADETLLDTTELSDGDDELYDPVGYEVIDLTDVVEADYDTLIDQVDSLLASDNRAKIDLLKKIPLISKIGHSMLELLALDSKTLTFGSSQTLFCQGDVGNAAYIIISGEAEVITEGPEGEITVATLGKNQFIGEISILIDVPRTATVTAMTELTVLVISKDMFYRMVTEFPTIGIEIMRELAHRLFKTTVQLR
jgi:CRP/FNR family cyclic AMP-dependent transcriptional regulator